MKKELLDALKAKFAGVSENVLGRVADKLAKTATTAEQVASAVDGVTLQQVLDSYGDSRATEAQQTAVKNYESKYGLKEGAKIDSGGAARALQAAAATTASTQEAGARGEQPEWVKAIIESNKLMAERLDKMDAERTTATRRGQLSGIIGKLPENLRKAYERTPVENLTDEQFAALTGEITTEVEGIVKDSQQKGAVFGKPTVTGGKQASEQLSKEQVEAISHRDGLPKQDEQPF